MFFQVVSNDVPHLCPFHLLGINSCANIISRHFRLCSPLTDFCLPHEVSILQGHISLHSSRTSCSNYFLVLRLKSCWRYFSSLLFCLDYPPLWFLSKQSFGGSKYLWLIEVRTGLWSTWTFPLLPDSYLLHLSDHTSYYDNSRLPHLSCLFLNLSYISTCVVCAMMHLCLPTILQYIYFVIFWDFSTEFGSNKEVVDIIFIIFILCPNINCPVALFPHLLHSLLKWGFPSFLFLFPLLSFPQIYEALQPYLAQLLHFPSKNFPLLYCFFYPYFNARTFSSGSDFSWFLFLFNSIFQNQPIYFLRSLNSILKMS